MLGPAPAPGHALLPAAVCVIYDSQLSVDTQQLITQGTQDGLQEWAQASIASSKSEGRWWRTIAEAELCLSYPREHSQMCLHFLQMQLPHFRRRSQAIKTTKTKGLV